MDTDRAQGFWLEEQRPALVCRNPRKGGPAAIS
jgi:hypothetical protein